MKKLLVAFVLGLAAFGTTISAADNCCMAPAPVPGVKSTLGVFNHLGLGVGVGTNGISVEAATPITRFLALRAGVHFMPDFKFGTDVDAYYNHPVIGESVSETIDVDCGLGRTQGSVLLNVYPIPSSSFFIAAGAYFSGDKLIKIKGHSDAMMNYGGMIEVGDYNIPVDKNGDVRGGLKVKGFRPYLGLGWGRSIPKRLLSFNFELGVQFEGKPEVYSETGDLKEITENEAANDFQDIIKHLKLYPNLTFRLSGKIF